MKRLILNSLLSIAILGLPGCKTASSKTPLQALAPGYLNPVDQNLGEALAALNGFATQEKINYAAETPALQATEKTPLNAFITSVDLANAAYTAYHAGKQTQTQAVTAINAAQTAQTTLVAAQGVTSK
jgi:hypothetical protein